MDNADNDRHVKVKEKRKLIETLKLLGAISGFLALLGSALTFIVVNSINIYKHFEWEEKIKVFKCSTLEGYLMSNTGDGDVYVDNVTFNNEDTKRFNVIYIRKIIKPNDFMEFMPNRKEMEDFRPCLVPSKNWPLVFAAINHGNKDLSMEYSLSGSSLKDIIKKAAYEKPDDLVTSNNGTATINFYGARMGYKHLKIAVEGIVWVKKDVNTINLE